MSNTFCMHELRTSESAVAYSSLDKRNYQAKFYLAISTLPLCGYYFDFVSFCRFQSSHDLALQALEALRLRAEYELMTSSIQVNIE